ncbi:hypothetical protein [Paenibacillus paeoniae]|uniref:Uncharacterized protein n=1 Tax=Paenibacillus paeoniae TaxID=2292705 RepID=A0A371PL43_9BACL|nr:hypothetical protein [Paenibacillus paeoniae]REK76823.1 hypothetical protein DX130_07270 [Paenibacillus paeoniae]
MKNRLKKAGLILLPLTVGGIITGFYLEQFNFAFTLMGLLVLVFWGWGAALTVKNRSNQHLDLYNSAKQEQDPIEKYSR